jgi:hypothetical protein
MIGYVLYMAANFYAVVWLMTLAGVFLGVCAAGLWCSQCTCITQAGVWYAAHSGKTKDAAISSFFGVFLFVYQTCE